MNSLTVLDILLFVLLAWGCVSGFMRGFVQEILSLGALIMALFALRLLHEPVTLWLTEATENESTASLIGFALIMLVIGGGGKLLARRIGGMTRSSSVGGFDRVLGAGFGMLKALLITATLFMLVNLGYDLAFGKDEQRPDWMRESRSYQLLSATSAALSDVIAKRLAAQHEGEDSSAADSAAPPPDAL